MSSATFELHARLSPKHELRVKADWYPALTSGTPGPYFGVKLEVWRPDRYAPERLIEDGGMTLYATPAQVQLLRDALTAALVEFSGEQPFGNRLREAFDLGVREACADAEAQGCQISPYDFDYQDAVRRELAHRASLAHTGELVEGEGAR